MSELTPAAAAADWNAKRAQAITELATTEATLKADFNQYVDTLAAYVERLKEANDVRSDYVREFAQEDVQNSTRTREAFLYVANDPIENKAAAYHLDPDASGRVIASIALLSACDHSRLLERKRL